MNGASRKNGSNGMRSESLSKYLEVGIRYPSGMGRRNPTEKSQKGSRCGEKDVRRIRKGKNPLTIRAIPKNKELGVPHENDSSFVECSGSLCLCGRRRNKNANSGRS
jgi:hypothetical protein